MSDPRNMAHAKKVTQEKKHKGTDARPQDAPAVQQGRKSSAAKQQQNAPAESATVTGRPLLSDTTAPDEAAAPMAPAALAGSLTVLAKLKDMDFHSRANLERLAELMLTVEDELKQKEFAGPLGEVFSAQDAFQTKLTALIEAYKTACGHA